MWRIGLYLSGMMRVVLIGILMGLVTPALAQRPQTGCVYTYFQKTKRVSTSICINPDGREGQALAFDRNGKEIYRGHERRFAGSEGTHFSYYPDGAVRKAEYHSAPDAGIQWYRSVTEFSPEGVVTNFWKDSHDDRVTILAPLENPSPTVKPPQPETVACAPIWVSEAWFINGSRYAVRVTGEYTGSIADPRQVLLAPGDTVRGGGFVGAAQFANPLRRIPYPFRLEAVGTRRKPSFRLQPADSVTTGTTRRYYLRIR